MLRVTGENRYWNCPVCGTHRNREGTIITPVGTSGHEGSVGSLSDGQYGRDGNSTGLALVTDHRPRCWKCGRVLGKYFTRPWSLKCRRCKATNQAH